MSDDLLGEKLAEGWEYEPPRYALGVAIYAERDDEILLLKRAAGSAFAGQWWVPGGAVDPGETPDEAVVRELKEESGLDVAEAPELVGCYIARLYGTEMLMLTYRAAVRGDVTVSAEHTDAQWVKAQDMRDFMTEETLARIAGDNERALANLHKIRADLDRYLRRIGRR